MFYLTFPANQRTVQVGTLEIPSLKNVRETFHTLKDKEEYVVDVQSLHLDLSNEGVLFQVASQVNLLEMASPNATPADGVSGYQCDRTQEPACAIAAGEWVRADL